MIQYSDDLMKRDLLTGRYVLTEDALRANGTDLRARLEYRRDIDAGAIIDRHLSRVSEVIYSYIYAHSGNNSRQDDWINSSLFLRNILYRAMLDQSEYMLYHGDLSRSVDPTERSLAIDRNAALMLDTVVPELGVSLLYSGT